MTRKHFRIRIHELNIENESKSRAENYEILLCDLYKNTPIKRILRMYVCIPHVYLRCCAIEKY